MGRLGAALPRCSCALSGSITPAEPPHSLRGAHTAQPRLLAEPPSYGTAIPNPSSWPFRTLLQLLTGTRTARQSTYRNSRFACGPWRRQHRLEEAAQAGAAAQSAASGYPLTDTSRTNCPLPRPTPFESNGSAPIGSRRGRPIACRAATPHPSPPPRDSRARRSQPIPGGRGGRGCVT